MEEIHLEVAFLTSLASCMVIEALESSLTVADNEIDYIDIKLYSTHYYF